MSEVQKKLQVAVTPRMAAFVHAKVAAGDFRSPADVVRAAIRLLQKQDQTDDLTLRSIRAKLASGLAQAERGELKDGDSIFDNLERGLDDIARGRATKRPRRKTSRAA